MTRTILRGLGYAVLIATAGYSFVYRFSNPTMTETQLFLAVGPLMLFGALVGIVLVCGTGKSRATEQHAAQIDERIEHRRAQRTEYLQRWQNREPGFVRCQECREVLRNDEPHDCINPNPPIRITQ